MNPTAALADRLAGFDRLVEVAVGRRTDVAETLADAGRWVTATDVHERAVPRGVSFVRDDLIHPDSAVYARADAVYARNLPRELHRPALAVAREADAELLFTTLGTEFPAISVEPEALASETLYVVPSSEGRRRPPSARGEHA